MILSGLHYVPADGKASTPPSVCKGSPSLITRKAAHGTDVAQAENAVPSLIKATLFHLLVYRKHSEGRGDFLADRIPSPGVYLMGYR
jgi:hypothetical protein